LDSGQEVAINADVAVSGLDIMAIPISVETMRRATLPLTATQISRLNDALTGQTVSSGSNALLEQALGQGDPYLGVDSLTASIQSLGLGNTFMVAPLEGELRPGRTIFTTDANTRSDFFTDPDKRAQTTAEDMGSLLAMIYYCAEESGGALQAAFGDELSSEKCQVVLDIMKSNRIGSLIEAGVPRNLEVAHRHGWTNELHGDAGIVYSPAGAYVLVYYMYQPEWLEWEVSSQLLSDVSRATYNYFNFDAPFQPADIGG